MAGDRVVVLPERGRRGHQDDPPGAGRLEVYLDGEKIFDRKEDEGGYPNWPKVNELKMVVAEKVYDFDAALTSD